MAPASWKFGDELLQRPRNRARRASAARRPVGLLVVLLALIALGAPATAAARHARRSPGLLFNGASKSAWGDQSAASTRIRNVRSPGGGGGNALRFQAFNQDVFPLTPSTNPRAQLVAGLPVRPGNQFWESYEIYLPMNFPVAASHHGWIALGSPAYGAPFAGSPSVGLEIIDGQFRYQRNGDASEPWQIAWQAPVVLGQWVRFTWHVLLSHAGYVQLYMNGQPQELADGPTTSSTLYMPVLDQTNFRGPWFSQLSVYYKHNLAPQVTIYFRDFRIATTEAVAVGE